MTKGDAESGIRTIRRAIGLRDAVLRTNSNDTHTATRLAEDFSLLASIQIGSGDMDGAMATIDRITTPNPKDWRAYFLAAEALARAARNLEEAGALDGAELPVTPSECRLRAIEQLVEAVEHGAENPQAFKMNEHLSGLRDLPEFQAILEKMRTRAEERVP